jgi:hypothetical protein
MLDALVGKRFENHFGASHFPARRTSVGHVCRHRLLHTHRPPPAASEIKKGAKKPLCTPPRLADGLATPGGAPAYYGNKVAHSIALSAFPCANLYKELTSPGQAESWDAGYRTTAKA